MPARSAGDNGARQCRVRDPLPTPVPGLRPPDLAVAAALAGLALAWRLPAVPGIEAHVDALSPILDALRLLGRAAPEPLPSPGVARALSHLPLVLGEPDGLLGAFQRRAALQATIPAAVYLAACARLPRRRGPLLAALLLLVGDSQLRGLLSSGGALLAPEWVGLAVLAAAFRSRVAAACSGLAVAMAVGNAPLALAAAPLLFSTDRRRWALGGLAVGLIPAVLAVVGWHRAGADLFHALAMSPWGAGRPAGDQLGNLVARWSEPTTAVLLGGALLALRVDRRGMRPLVIALALAAVGAFAAGWLHEGWWRPLAPWLGVAFAVAVEGSTRRVRVGLAGAALVAVALAPFPATFDGDPSGLGRVGPVHALAVEIDGRRAEGPWAILAVAESGGDARSALLGVVLDRTLAGRATGLFAEGPRPLRTRPLLVHVEGQPPFLARARASLPPGLHLLGAGERSALVEAPDLAAARPWLDRLCGFAGRALEVDGPAAWHALLGRGPFGPIFTCPE
jgi:hypothetical protein